MITMSAMAARQSPYDCIHLTTKHHRALGSSHGNACWNAIATAKAGLLGNSPRYERPYFRKARIKSRVVTVSDGHDPKILFPLDRVRLGRAAVHVGERLAVSIAHDVAAGHLFASPWHREAASQ